MKPSATLEINARAKQLRSQGVDVISFAAGEPDFPTPAHVIEAAAQAMAAGHTRYTAVPGDPELRALVATQTGASWGREIQPDQVLIGCGAKQVIAHFYHVALDPGDEVIVPTPCWLSYPPQIRMVGGDPVMVPTTAENGWRLTPEALKAHIGPRTRALVLNAPCNPTGAGYGERDLAALAEVVLERDLWVLSDEIYGKVTFNGFVQKSMIQAVPEVADRILVINGVSKTYSMTGWRVGWGVGPAPLISAISRIAGQVTSCAPAFAQRAAIAALQGDQSFFDEWMVSLTERMEVIVAGLNAMEGVTCRQPEGTFYAMADVRGALGRRPAGGEPIVDSVALARYLLEAARVAVVPGEPFQSPGFVRFSFACTLEQVKTGLERVGEALAALR
jgi:aspartate aminotransferase